MSKSIFLIGAWVSAFVLPFGNYLILSKESLSLNIQHPVAAEYLSREDTLAQWMMMVAAFAGVGVSLWAIRILRETLKEARNTTRAALTAVDSTRRLERAYIFEEITTPAGEFSRWFATYRQTNRSDLQPQIYYNLTNFGKTPAIIKEISVGSDSRIDCNFPVYSVLDIKTELILAAGESNKMNVISTGTALNPENIDRLEMGNIPLNFYARVSYCDIFGDEHVTAFYWTFNSETGRFGPHNGPNQNFNRRT